MIWEQFAVDPSVDACTQGIWMWTKPVYIEKDNMHVFFLDTEGTESTDRDQTHDAKLFTLAILMSSYFMFNTVSVLDEDKINQLSLVTHLAKNIIISSEEETNEFTLSYFAPKLLWIIRDFVLEIRDTRGRSSTPNQYLESALTDLVRNLEPRSE